VSLLARVNSQKPAYTSFLTPSTIKPAGLDFITALRAPAIRKLVDAGQLQLSLFDDRDLAEISAPDYPGERLIVCRNPLLADERARKRRELLDATERKLHDVQSRVRRANKPLRGQDAIGVAVGKVIDHYKMAKHFEITITDDDLVIARKTPPAPKPLPITPFHCVPGDLVDSGLVVIATIKFLLNSIARRQRTES